MGKYRIAQILSEKTLDSSGTEVIDIDVADPISAILFEYKNTRGSSTSIGHVASALSKIELVDGSEVLFSLSGKQLHALDYYDKGKPPYTFITNMPTVMELIAPCYNFGRHLWDPRFALDPKRFRNPQLKITHNRLTPDASSSAHTLKILGYLFDEKQISPEGFMSAREIKSYTPGADGTYEYTDLPTDKTMRKLLVEAYDDAYAPWQVANELRLSEDNDKKVPLDEKVSTLMKLINTLYPRWTELVKGVLTTTAIDFYCTPGFDIMVKGCTTTQSGILDVESVTNEEPFAIGASASVDALMEVSGFNPHSIVPVLFGDQNDPDDWYDLTKVGNLKLRVKAGSAGTAGAIKIFTQQVTRY